MDSTFGLHSDIAFDVDSLLSLAPTLHSRGQWLGEGYSYRVSTAPKVDERPHSEGGCHKSCGQVSSELGEQLLHILSYLPTTSYI